MRPGLPEVVNRLRRQPQSIAFRELRRVCEECFGAPRRQGGSHLVFKTGLREPALVNIQPKGKMAKPYQCRQVADAIEAKLKGDD
jgi:hypothetical protein